MRLKKKDKNVGNLPSSYLTDKGAVSSVHHENEWIIFRDEAVQTRRVFIAAQGPLGQFIVNHATEDKLLLTTPTRLYHVIGGRKIATS